MSVRMEPAAHAARPHEAGRHALATAQDGDGTGPPIDPAMQDWGIGTIWRRIMEAYDHDGNGYLWLMDGQSPERDERLRSVAGSSAVSGYQSLRLFDSNLRDHRVTSPEITFTLQRVYDWNGNKVIDDTLVPMIDGDTGEPIVTSERGHLVAKLGREATIDLAGREAWFDARDAESLPDTPKGWLPDPRFETGPHPPPGA